MEEKQCIVCNAVLIKRKFESRKKYSKKKFCTAEHARQYFKENKMAWWSPENKQLKRTSEDENWE